jgi:hypothetical protein
MWWNFVNRRARYYDWGKNESANHDSWNLLPGSNRWILNMSVCIVTQWHWLNSRIYLIQTYHMCQDRWYSCNLQSSWATGMWMMLLWLLNPSPEQVNQARFKVEGSIISISIRWIQGWRKPLLVLPCMKLDVGPLRIASLGVSTRQRAFWACT